MNQYGKITHYDAQTGTGMISPERGGDALPFNKSGLQQQGQEPRSDQLYTYETVPGPSGAPHAVNLQMEQGGGIRQQAGSGGGFDQQGESDNHHNQEAARRGGVDQQSQSQNPERGNLDGVSRTGSDQPDRQPGGGTGGGSTFQPLEADTSKAHRSPERQHDLGHDAQGRDERLPNTPGTNPRRT